MVSGMNDDNDDPEFMPQRVMGNGRPQWPDLRTIEAALRAEWNDDLRRLEHHLQENVERERNQCSTGHAAMVAEVKELRARVDEGEAFHDRLRGMSTVILFLIGSNLALVLLTALGLIVALQ